MDIGAWIKTVRLSKGLTQTQLGETLGRTKANVSAWEKDAHEPSYSQVLAIAALADWTIYPPGIPTPAEKAEQTAVAPLANIVATAQAANDDELVEVRKAAVKIIGGDPVVAVDHTGPEFNGVIYLAKSWLMARGLSRDKVFAAAVKGDSMAPRILEGDLLLINQADTAKRSGYVYGLSHEGKFMVKRLRKDGRHWMLVSDNPDHPPLTAGEHTVVIGRVVLMKTEQL